MPSPSALARVAVLCLVACRPTLAPVSPEPRVAPSDGAGVQVCWLESRGRFGFTASALVVRHPDGDVLIDAGNSTNFNAEIDVYQGKTKRWLATFPGSLKPRQSLSLQLQAMHVDPAALRWVVPTHAHLDHLGGVLDLPPTPVLMSAAEADLVIEGTRGALFAVVPAHAHAVAPNMVPLVFAGGPYEIFEAHADLFGDGSVVVVPLPGHTPGSVGVFVRRSDGRRLFHVGDAVNARRQITDLQGRARFMRDTDSDRIAAERIVARLHAWAAQVDDVIVVPAHERAAWVDAFGTPTADCRTAAAR